MNREKHWGKTGWLCVLLLTVLIALAACSKNEGGSRTSSNKPLETESQGEGKGNSSESGLQEKEKVTLTVFGAGGADFPGIQSDPVSQEIERQTGITIETIAFDEDRLKLMLADGELPDILMVDHKYMKQMIEGKLIINMDDYLSSAAPDISTHLTDTLAYFRKNMSEGQDKLFFLPIHTGTSKEVGASAPQYEYSVGYWTRWDLYKELGYPEIHSTDDFLDLLADMQELYPTTPDGKKVYGVSAYNGGLWPFIIQHAFADGYYNGPGTFVQDPEGRASELLLDKSSTFWNSMNYFFKANQMGLLDPESFTQQMDQYSAKLDSLQLLSSIANWWTGGGNRKLAESDPEAGYAMIPIRDSGVYKGGFSPTGWSGKYLAVSRSSKHPDRAMELLNFLFTPEGSRLAASGIQGVHWDLVDGVPQMLDETIEAYKTMDSFANETGIGKWGNLQGIDDLVVHPGDNGLINLFYTDKVFLTRLTPLDAAYSAYYGASYPGEALQQQVDDNKIFWASFDTTVQTGLESAPDDIKRIDAKVEELIKTTMPKLILAKDQDEFVKVQADFFDSLEKMNYGQSVAFWENNWKQALEKTKLKQ